MKQEAVLIFNRDYYNCKCEFINKNYQITNYVSIDETLEECFIEGNNKIIGLNDLINLKPKKVIMAMPISCVFNNIILLLYKLGVHRSNIVLLLKESPYYQDEAEILYFNKNVDYFIDLSGEIICKINGSAIFVEEHNRLNFINEIFGKMCYDFYIPNDHITVIDIGMNVGMATIFFSKKENVDNVYAFEPFIPTYNRAIANLTLNRTAHKITTHQFGLSSSNNKMELAYNGALSGIMSTVRDNMPFVSTTEKQDVEVRDAATVFQSIIDENPHNAFVFKIDCEGGEYDILERLNETGLIRKIKVITMEWHNFKDKNVSLIEDILIHNSFTYQKTKNYGVGVTGMIFAVAT